MEASRTAKEVSWCSLKRSQCMESTRATISCVAAEVRHTQTKAQRLFKEAGDMKVGRLFVENAKLQIACCFKFRNTLSCVVKGM